MAEIDAPAPMPPETGLTAAQASASAPGKSVWVAASAGSGKTKVLADRVVRLLLDGTPPERILCLTFTRAAAAEMAKRINAQVAGWAVDDDAALDRKLGVLTAADVEPDAGLRERARRLFAEILDVPGRLKILTIHGFCESVLRRFPLEAGIAPHFELMDERTAEEALAAAREAVLYRARSGDGALDRALSEIAGRIGQDEFAGLMTALVKDHDRLQPLGDTGGEGDKGGPDGFDELGLVQFENRLRARLGIGPGENAQSILTEACGDTAYDGPGLRVAVAALLTGSDADRRRADGIARWLDDAGARGDRLETYCGIFFTKPGAPRATLITQQALAHAPEAAETLAGEAARLAAVIEKQNALGLVAASAAIARVGQAVTARYEAEKRVHARLDYDDLILKVRRLLEQVGGAAWVHYKLDGGIQHVLVDEAQDTNPDQWAIIRALTSEFFAGEGGHESLRTMFAVGDAKQSIYSFQRADPRQFDRMNAHFEDQVRAAGQDWDNVELMESFRSTGPVLRSVDAVFAPEEMRKGVSVAPIRHNVHRLGQAGLVELWPPVAPTERAEPEPWALSVPSAADDAPASRLALAIAARIRGWLDEREVLASRARAVRPGDVVVLVRRRTGFVHDLFRALKAAEVPVSGIDRMVLSDQLAIKDLIACGEFALLPEDDLTLATMLKGPLAGLDEDALFALAHGRGDRSLWQTLYGRRDQSPVFAAAAALGADLLGRADTVPPYEFYADLLGRRRGRERLVARLGKDANDPIDEFLSLALAYERSHPPSLQGFLHWFAAGLTEIKRDLEQNARDEVRVMTVHGAKGLEAPIVFLADTMQVPRPAQSPADRLYWGNEEDVDREDPVMMWVPRQGAETAEATARREARDRRQREEQKRLLYVAMTRAEDRLYVCGYETRKNRPDQCWYDLIQRGLEPIAEPWDADIFSGAPYGWSGPGLRLEVSQAANVAPDRAEGAGAQSEAVAPLPDWAQSQAPPEPRPSRTLAPSRPAEDEPPPNSPLGLVGNGVDGGVRFRRGILVHRLLEMLPELEPNSRHASAMRYLAQPGHGLAEEEQAALATETLAILDEPDFALLFGPDSRPEVPITGVIGDSVISGQVDRLAVAGEDVLVIDYKTHRDPPLTEAEVASLYLRQMAAYRSVLRAVYPGKSVRCALLWTDGPSLMALADDLLDRYAP